MLKKVSHIVAHNAIFDMSILKSELFRLGLYSIIDELNTKQILCTMKHTKKIVKALNKIGNIKYSSDWLIESTCLDIELIYFTQSIEYYKYLLEKPFKIWATGLSYPFDLVIDGNYMYVTTSYEFSSITKILKLNLSLSLIISLIFKISVK